MSETKKVVIAFGGNMILKAGQKGTYDEQRENVEKAVAVVGQIVEQGYQVICTHGNGPQVGNLLWQQSANDSGLVPPQPLHICVAMTQGQIGLMIQNALQTDLKKRNLDMTPVSLVTRVVVDGKDPGFENPTKGVGKFFTKEQAEELMKENEDVYKEDAGRGWRLHVASPVPQQILEISNIQNLVENGYCVIAAGGGGIPVVETSSGEYVGVPAVVDKDRASAVLAAQLNADILLILTDVSEAYIQYNTPNQKALTEITVEEAEMHIQNEEFSMGSMHPKVQASVNFVKKTKKPAIITNPENTLLALQGKAGTTIKYN